MGFVRSALTKALAPLGYEVVKRRQAPSNGPSVLLVTLPKSGSMFLQRSLAANMGLAHIDISPGYFPVDNIDLQSILEFRKGGYVATSHLNASPFNLNLLSRFCDRWVVHLRDPRAALLSWTHFRDRPDMAHDPKMQLRHFPQEPDTYFTMSFAEKIDWQIENYFPRMIEWIEGWAKIAADSGYSDRVVITNHEQIVGRDAEFIKDMARGLGIAMNGHAVKLPPNDRSTHFRTGSLDEWCAALTSTQIETASQMIPQHLMDRFGWIKRH